MKTTTSLTVPEFVDALVEALKVSGRAGQYLTADFLETLLRQVVPESPPPVRHYPRYVHWQRVVNHVPEKPPVLVRSAEEAAALGQGWGLAPPPTHEEGYPRWASFHYPGHGQPSQNMFGDPSHPGLPPIMAYNDAEQKECLDKGLVPSKILVHSAEELEKLPGNGGAKYGEIGRLAALRIQKDSR